MLITSAGHHWYLFNMPPYKLHVGKTSSSLLASAQTMIFYMVYNGISSQRTCKKILEVVYKVGSLRSCYSRVNQLG